MWFIRSTPKIIIAACYLILLPLVADVILDHHNSVSTFNYKTCPRVSTPLCCQSATITNVANYLFSTTFYEIVTLFILQLTIFYAHSWQKLNTTTFLKLTLIITVYMFSLNMLNQLSAIITQSPADLTSSTHSLCSTVIVCLLNVIVIAGLLLSHQAQHCLLTIAVEKTMQLLALAWLTLLGGGLWSFYKNFSMLFWSWDAIELILLVFFLLILLNAHLLFSGSTANLTLGASSVLTLLFLFRAATIQSSHHLIQTQQQLYVWLEHVDAARLQPYKIVNSSEFRILVVCDTTKRCCMLSALFAAFFIIVIRSRQYTSICHNVSSLVAIVQSAWTYFVSCCAIIIFCTKFFNLFGAAEKLCITNMSTTLLCLWLVFLASLTCYAISPSVWLLVITSSISATCNYVVTFIAYLGVASRLRCMRCQLPLTSKIHIWASIVLLSIFFCCIALNYKTNLIATPDNILRLENLIGRFTLTIAIIRLDLCCDYSLSLYCSKLTMFCLFFFLLFDKISRKKIIQNFLFSNNWWLLRIALLCKLSLKFFASLLLTSRIYY